MISMANEKGKPTDKQIAALRKFRISESEIQAMSFSQASSRLDELIGQARARKQGQQGGAGSGNSNGSSAGAGSGAEPNAPEEDRATTSRGSPAPGRVHAPVVLPISDGDAIGQQQQQQQQQQERQQHEHHPPSHNLPGGSEEQTYDVDQEMLESKGFIEQHFMGDYARSELVAEHARQKFAIFMAKMIQKNKQSNMERISKD
jgi:hypothetical protein